MVERTRRIWTAALPFALAMLAAAAPPGRVTLGQFGAWGAFRDAVPERCFAIARLRSSKGGQASAAISTWPRLRAHDQFHLRLSRAVGGEATLEVEGRRFPLHARGDEAWATTMRDDARIVAAMRGGGVLQVRGVDRRGHRFRDRYPLDGAASAIDAMRLACLPD